jgi:hypothetical protein
MGTCSPKMLERLINDTYDLAVVICTEHNSIDVMHPYQGDIGLYDNIRQQLDALSIRKKIILATSVYNDELDGTPTPNINRIALPGGFIMTQKHQYLKLAPVLEKNLKSKKHWVSLSRCLNHHRVMMSCVLLGYELGLSLGPEKDTGRLQISQHSVQNYTSWQDYWGVPITESGLKHSNHLQRGFEMLQKGFHGGQPDGRVGSTGSGIDNASNFDTSLRHYYADSVIEIVNDTTFYNPGSTVNEKYLNSIYGLNFPILCSNAGTVEHLRTLGFDLFDDVIDHSYDSIQDPIDRMFAMVDQNMDLLIDGDFARRQWLECYPRLVDNHDCARTMYRRFMDQAVVNLNKKATEMFNL